jgi:hypothetical protein
MWLPPAAGSGPGGLRTPPFTNALDQAADRARSNQCTGIIVIIGSPGDELYRIAVTAAGMLAIVDIVED